VPRLWGHKYKHGVFKLSSRWAKDIWQDVRKVGENLGIKNYDAISVRADEDFLTAESPLYQADAIEQTKVEGFETSGIEVLDDVRKRKTGMDTEGDKLLDALNADRCETIKALIGRFGANRLEKEKDMLSQNIMYCGMNDARELKGVSDYATQEWSFLKNSTRNQVFEVKFDEFRYQNEEEFKKNFVKNYKKLQYFDLMYEDYFGEKKDPDFANRGLPEGHYGAEFYERLKLIHLIKEDYDRRIEKLQGWEIPKQKKTGFWMGMDSQALEDYLNKNVEKNGKADAKRQSDMADKIITEYTAYCEKNKEKYKDNMDDENVYPPESMFDFMKTKAEKLPVPKFTDEELSNETLLTADYDQGFNLGGVDIANEQRMIVNFKNSREFKKLPARLRRAYSGELEKYRERRREYEKRCNLEKIYQEYSMELPGSTDFSIRRDGVTFNKNPYFDEDQQYPIQYLNAVMNRVDPGLIRRNGEVDQMAPESNTKLFQDAQEFTNFRMKHGICLTKDDKRWKMLEKFEKDFVVPENLYVTVRITCNGKVTEMRTIRAFEEKDLNLNIEAKSEEELNTIREELAEQEKLMRKVQSYAVFMQKNVGSSGEIKGVMGSEFDALRRAMFEKAKAISGYYLKKDDKEAKKAYIEGKLEEFEEKGDFRLAGEFVLKCYSKAGEGNPEEREIAANYLKNLKKSLAAEEELSDEEKKYAGKLLEYVQGEQEEQEEQKEPGLMVYTGKYEKKDKPYSENEKDLPKALVQEFREIDEQYKNSGIPKEDLKVLKDSARATYEIKRTIQYNMPEEIRKEVNVFRKEMPGTDCRDFYVMHRPIKVDEKGEPLTKKDQKTRELNKKTYETFRSGKLSERKDHLDYIMNEMNELLFSSRQLMDVNYIREHKEKAIRHLSFSHTLANILYNHRGYYLKKADPKVRVLAFLMEGSQYHSITNIRLNYALFGYGHGNAAIGKSSNTTVYPAYEEGLDYKKYKAVNKKLSEVKSPRAVNDFDDPYAELKRREIDPYSKEGQKITFGAIAKDTDYDSLQQETRYLVKLDNKKAIKSRTDTNILGEKFTRKEVKNDYLYDMSLRYIDEYIEKRNDPAYIEKMNKIIDGFLAENLKEGKKVVENKEGVIDDLD
jgi:hypothetical protein